MPAESLLISKAVDVVVRAVPRGFSRVKSWWLGKEILIIGQARAGKTTFRDYLEYGIFEDERETQETAEIEATERFDVGVGRNQALQLVISSALDIPGQVGATEHANLAFARNPHALIIVLDQTTPLTGEPDRASAAWLSRFCRRYEAKWRANRGRRHRIKSVVVLMNKADKVDPSVVTVAKQAYEKIITDELRDARGKMLADVEVLPCSVVTNPKKTALVDSVISEIAKAFGRKQ